jgi:hypothetical protein
MEKDMICEKIKSKSFETCTAISGKFTIRGNNEHGISMDIYLTPPEKGQNWHSDHIDKLSKKEAINLIDALKEVIERLENNDTSA